MIRRFDDLDDRERYRTGGGAAWSIWPGLDDLDDLGTSMMRSTYQYRAAGNVVVTRTASTRAGRRTRPPASTSTRGRRPSGARSGGSSASRPRRWKHDEPSTASTGSTTATTSKSIYAYVELGGLLVGLYDTLYDGEMSPEFDVGGGTSAHQIRYTFTGANGMTFAVSIEEQDYNYDYTPNVVGRVGLTQGWGGVALFAAYDATFEEFGLKGIASFEHHRCDPARSHGHLRIRLRRLQRRQRQRADRLRVLAGRGALLQGDRSADLPGRRPVFRRPALVRPRQLPVAGQVDWVPVENLILRGQLDYNGGDSQDFIDGQIRLEASF